MRKGWVFDLNGRIIAVAASIIAGCIVMILHELPKSMYIYFKVKHDKVMIGSMKSYFVKMKFVNLFKLWEYLDPLGLLFCIVFRVGFSRSSFYKNNHNYLYYRKTGIVGFTSLIIQFLSSSLILKYVFEVNKYFTIKSDNNILCIGASYVCAYTALISLGMLITNFFPISFFNSSLFVSGIRSVAKPDVKRNDYKYLIILIMIYLTGIISDFCFKALELFLGYT